MKVDTETKQRAAQKFEQLDLKVESVAKKIGTSYSTLWNFLYGKTHNFGSLSQLAEEMGVSIEYLLTGSNTKGSKFHNNDDETLVELAIRAEVGREKPSEKILNFLRKGTQDWIKESRERGETINAEHLTRLVRTLIKTQVK